MTDDRLDDPTSGTPLFTPSMITGLAAGAIGEPAHRRAV
jgi:hypothetical protein